jgi:hypothetical protein
MKLIIINFSILGFISKLYSFKSNLNVYNLNSLISISGISNETSSKFKNKNKNKLLIIVGN